MTSENSPEGGVDTPARRRMAGYLPLPGPEAADAASGAGQDAPVPDQEVPSAATGESLTADAQGATVPQTAGRKRRMGAASNPPGQSPEVTGPAPVAAGRTRMGAGAGKAVSASEGAAAPADAGAAASRVRMSPPASTRMSAAAQPANTAPQTRTTPPSGTASTSPVVRTEDSGGGRATWIRPAATIAGLVILAVVVVLAARWLRTLEPVREFVETYTGHASQPQTAPAGIPAWLGWQHFFNMFLMVLIIRTGLQVRNERKPPGYWTAKKDSFFSPRGNTPKKVSLTQWLHQLLDVAWVVNGTAFIVLLAATGQWMRIVPTSWDIFPNMVSGALQYASLDWPTEDGWIHYNALQVMAYFLVVFVAAPLAILSGLRISTWWPESFGRLNKIYPVEWARAVHFPVMLYFVLFTIVHVFLVFFTGALANLNHMYTSRDAVDWWGLVIFLISLVVTAAAWFLAKPLFTTPIAARTGTVTK